MASSTENVKMGVCRVYYAGRDLGYTKGGVEVEVVTDTHKMTVDQFGETTINEYIMKRDITIKLPLAETTVLNLIEIMPGSTLVHNGTNGSRTVTFTANPTNNQTLVFNGKTVTFKTAGAISTNLEVLIGATQTDTVANLALVLNKSREPELVLATYAAAAGVLTITAKRPGPESVNYTVNSPAGTFAGVTIPGAALTAGNEPTLMRANVTTGVGSNLLSISSTLVLRPLDLDKLGDNSEDLVIPRAATAGGMQFAYKFNDERIFNTTFMGYPDPATDVLFKFGDPDAV